MSASRCWPRITAPNRLERAKAEVTDLLSYLEGDKIGLIAFAGRAAVLCPLTPDFGFFRLILDGASPTRCGPRGERGSRNRSAGSTAFARSRMSRG